MRRIVYLENSGFALELEGLLLAFDICSSKPVPGKRGLAGGVVDEETLRPFERRALFFSHSHRDHYDPAAFRLPGCEKYISFEFPKTLRACSMEPARSWSGTGFGSRPSAPPTLASAFWCAPRGFASSTPGTSTSGIGARNPPRRRSRRPMRFTRPCCSPCSPTATTSTSPSSPWTRAWGKTTMEGALDFAARLRPRLTIPMHMQGDAALGLAFERAMAGAGRAAKCLPHRGDWLDIDQALQTGGHEA